MVAADVVAVVVVVVDLTEVVEVVEVVTVVDVMVVKAGLVTGNATNVGTPTLLGVTRATSVKSLKQAEVEVVVEDTAEVEAEVVVDTVEAEVDMTGVVIAEVTVVVVDVVDSGVDEDGMTDPGRTRRYIKSPNVYIQYYFTGSPDKSLLIDSIREANKKAAIHKS